MKVRNSRRFCRNALHFLIASAITLASTGAPTALADEVECGGQAVNEELQASRDTVPAEASESLYEEELCGWATHDSCVFFDRQVTSAYPRIARRTSCNFDQSIAAAAATACATAGISVEQIVEPFAMVGPHVSDSMRRIREFQEWWQETVAEAQQQLADSSLSECSPKAVDPWTEFGESVVVRAETAPLVVEEQIDSLALEEPVDVDPWGGSVLVVDDSEFFTRLPDPPSIPDASVAQVGASPVIVSIDDAYWPYDLSARDLRVWSVFPLVTEPFCIRGRNDSEPASDSWADLDQATTERIIELSTEETAELSTEGTVENDMVIDSPTPVVHQAPLIEASPECLLDDLIWTVTCAFDAQQDLQVWLRPRGIGEQLAEIALRASRVAGTATERIAGVWPETPPVVEAKPVTAGQQLLARAGAIEAGEPVAEADVPGPAASVADAATVIVR